MALSPYINETVLTASIESVVPISAQGTLTQIVATSEYDIEAGRYIYRVKATGGGNEYQIGQKSAISASTCVGVSFSGREGTATFDITPTAEGYTYKATSITDFYGSVNSKSKLATKIYGSVPTSQSLKSLTGTPHGWSGASGSGPRIDSFDADKTIATLQSEHPTALLYTTYNAPMFRLVVTLANDTSPALYSTQLVFGTLNNTVATLDLDTSVRTSVLSSKYGMTIQTTRDGSNWVTLTPTYEPAHAAKLIHQKL